METTVEREGSRKLRTPGIYRYPVRAVRVVRLANRGDRDRHPETFITFGFKGAHCAVNGVPRVPSFLLSRSYVPWIRSILRRLPFREFREGDEEGRRMGRM